MYCADMPIRFCLSQSFPPESLPNAGSLPEWNKDLNRMRESFLATIGENIAKSGHHITSVLGSESPRFLYTIGLTKTFGSELILAGCATLGSRRAGRLLNLVAERLTTGEHPSSLNLEFEEFGSWTLGEVDPSWVAPCLLGVLDFYQVREARAWQLLPVEEKRTIDIPDMSLAFAPETHRVWKWLQGGWPYSVSANSVAITNLDALQGYAISELVRWEQEEWEMFSGPGPDVPKEEMFPVPLATLLAYDSSLEAALELKIGAGLYREFSENGQAGDWQAWRSKS